MNHFIPICIQNYFQKMAKNINEENKEKEKRKRDCSINVLHPAKDKHPKYSKRWPYTAVAHTIDCVCSKILNHGLNHGLFISLFKLTPCPIHWIVYVLAYSNFIFEF